MTWDAAHEAQVDRLEEQLGVFHRRSRRFLRSFASRVHPEMDAGGYAVLLMIAQAAPLRLNELADPQDGRAFLLRPSPDGEHRLAAATEARRVEWRGRLDGWSTADLAAFVAGLTRLNADLDAPPGRPSLRRHSSRPTG